MYKLTLNLTLLLSLLWIVTVVSAQEIREVGFCRVEGYLGGVTVSGDCAYVATDIYGNEGDYGFQVINVSNPRAPECITFFDTEWGVRDFIVEDTLVYLAVINEGLYILDISDIENIEEIGFLRGQHGWIQGIELTDRYLYWHDNGRRVGSIVVSNLERPRYVEVLVVPSAPCDLEVAGDYMYSANLSSFRIFDVSGDIEVIGVLDDNIFEYASCVEIRGEIAYVGDYYRGLFSVDVSDPENPELIGHCEVTDGGITKMVISGKYAYVISHRNGLRLVDITNPEDLEEIASYDSQFASDVYVLNDLVYMINIIEGGLHILDASSFFDPTIEVPESVEFGTVQCDRGVISFIPIYNAGGDSLVIEDITSSSPHFSTNFEDPLVLGNLDTIWVQVSFSPLEVGEFEDTLTIVSNDPDGDATILLTGIGERGSEVTNFEFDLASYVRIGVDPEALEFFDTPFDGSDSLMILIENTGTLDAMVTQRLVGDPTFTIGIGGGVCRLSPGSTHETWIHYTPSFDPDGWSNHYASFVIEVGGEEPIIVSVRGTSYNSVRPLNLLLLPNHTLVSIFDLQGRKIGRNPRDFRTLTTGTYILLMDVEGVTCTQKITLVK